MSLLPAAPASRSEDARWAPGRTPPSRAEKLRDVVEQAENALSRLADDSVRIADLAGAARVSARTVYRAFARHRGAPPIASLRRARLAEVRRRLQAGEAGDTVTRAALDCGFQHLSRFAAFYRSSFGEQPSETLRRASRL